MQKRNLRNFILGGQDGLVNILGFVLVMAAASQGIVIGFHVLANAHVNKIAEQNGVKIKLYQVIYNLVDDVKKLLLGLVEPEMKELITGEAEILKIGLKFFLNSENSFS